VGLNSYRGPSATSRWRWSSESLGDLETLGQAKHVDGTDHACFGREDRIPLVVDGGCRAGEVENFSYLDKQGMRYIVAK
jgi:hypothetical protein